MNHQEQNETNAEKSFAELMAENPVETDWLQAGQKIEASIVKITPEWIFLDLGGKSEGYLDVQEFRNENGEIAVKEGDLIKAYFLSSRNNEKLFTTKVGKGDAGRAYLEDAWQSGIPVEGKITKEIKGGLEVTIAGNIRAFCPFSQTGFGRNENVLEYIGKQLPFKITEYKEKGRNIVLSRRKILEEEKEQQKERLKEVLKEGMIIEGEVMSVHNFGAFVDIGGTQGLLPLSELGWDKSVDINEVLRPGDRLSMSILKLDWENNKISLSRKATLQNPWDNVENTFPKGSSCTGTVVSLTNFGAFVTLGTGIEGLIHISKLGKGKRIKHAGETLVKGQSINVRVEAVDIEKKRISLTLEDGDKATEDEQPGDYGQDLTSTPFSFGSFGDKLKNKLKPSNEK